MIDLRQILSVFAAGFLAAVAVGDEPVQWSTAEGGNGHWYARYPAQSNFDQMLSNAMAIGGNLASVTSAEENAFLAKLAGGVPGAAVYFGARSVAGCPGNFEWTDGSPWEYTNWGANQPMCYLGAPVGFEGDQWYDIFNYGMNAEAVIVEWSADCNDDGIVDYGQILDGTFPDENENGIPDSCEEINRESEQWRVELGGNGHWYRAERSPGITWEQASIIAESTGGHLATPTTDEENTYLYGMIDSPAYWIVDSYNNASGPYLGAVREAGASAPDEGWYWVSGEPWEFTAWAPIQPNNANGNQDRMHFWNGTPERAPGWNDIPGGQSSEFPGSFIIEWSADCNNDGIVDHGQILDGSVEDLNANGIPDCCEPDSGCSACLGDITENGTVDAADLGILLALWGTDGQNNPLADINLDGLVDGGDLGLLLFYWGACP